MNIDQQWQLALNPALIFEAMGKKADPWQAQFLRERPQRALLNCCRQSGKSTVISVSAIDQALLYPKSLILILSKSQRQSGELFKKCMEAYQSLGRPVKAEYETQLTITLANGSRIICLPGDEASIRGYSSVALLIIDEASRVPDDLYRSVRPMLAVSKGRLVAMSTPWGERGWFYKEWKAENNIRKYRIPWTLCPRITPEFIEEERKSLGDAWIAQEYECQFGSVEGLVYPDFAKCHTDLYQPFGTQVGGLDYGWRNPFAAEWGRIDKDGIIWIQDERYLRATPIQEHAAALPKGITWYADPAGAQESSSLKIAGHIVRKGLNEIRLGIAAVTNRIRTGTLKVNQHRCPNLCEEATAYRYPDKEEKKALGEAPIDDHNHALGALRYLISRIDARFINKLRKSAPDTGPITDTPPPPPQPQQPEPPRPVPIEQPKQTNDEHLWTTL